MNSNQWAGSYHYVPGATFQSYGAFLVWAKSQGFEESSAGMATSLIDPTNYDAQLDVGMSWAQAMALFRAYAIGKVNSFAAVGAVADSSTLGGTATPNIHGHTPQAGGDAWSVTAGTTLTKDASHGVLINDSATDNYSLTAVLVSQPKYGSLTLAADGSFTYTPYPYVTGTDEFTYLVSDGHGGTAWATVTLQIVPPS
jgi:VCBS repeat-containing protein